MKFLGCLVKCLLNIENTVLEILTEVSVQYCQVGCRNLRTFSKGIQVQNKALQNCWMWSISCELVSSISGALLLKGRCKVFSLCIKQFSTDPLLGVVRVLLCRCYMTGTWFWLRWESNWIVLFVCSWYSWLINSFVNGESLLIFLLFMLLPVETKTQKITDITCISVEQ